MPIRPFLAGEPFDPEIIAQMSLALESACEALGLKLVDDPATRLVAEKIIALVQRGVRDADTLTMRLQDQPEAARRDEYRRWRSPSDGSSTCWAGS